MRQNYIIDNFNEYETIIYEEEFLFKVMLNSKEKQLENTEEKRKTTHMTIFFGYNKLTVAVMKLYSPISGERYMSIALHVPKSITVCKLGKVY